MAGQDNTVITLFDKSANTTTVITPDLDTGKTIVVNVDVGDILTADKDVQVDLVYGDIGSTYELRWSSLIAREDWSNDYYSPVGTVNKTTAVEIDDDADGYGWSNSLDQVASGKVDLLSTVTHEFGHVLGLEHDVMGEALGVGERHLPLDQEDLDLLKQQYSSVFAVQTQF